MASAALNEWVSHGPGNWDVQGLAIDPSAPPTVYAGSLGGGLFKSIDARGSWSLVDTPRKPAGRSFSNQTTRYERTPA